MPTEASKRPHAKQHPPQRRTVPKRAETQNGFFSKETLRAYLITLAIGGGLILIFSLGAYFYANPAAIIRPLAYLAASLTSFFGGRIAKKLCGGAPAICGLTNGILLTCTMMLISFCFRAQSSHYSPLVSTLLHSAVPILSFLGAWAGTNKRKPTTKRR